MPIGAIAGATAVAGIGGAAIGASAQKKAANTAAQTARDTTAQNNALLEKVRAENVGILSPFVLGGLPALQTRNALLGLGSDAAAAESAFKTYRDSTGYDFRIDQGMRGLNASFAARGLGTSGKAIKDALKFGQGIASDEFGRYMGYLGDQQNTGLSAGNALAGVGTQFANSVSANNNNAASITANSSLIAGNANASMWNGIGGSVGGALNQFAMSSYGGGMQANPYGVFTKNGGGIY